MRTALIVDDDYGIAELLQRVLRRCGFAPRIAASLRDVAEALDEVGQLDLIVLDWNIPTAKEGAQALALLRSCHPNASVVLSSGENVDQPTAAGLPRLAKPYRPSDVRACLVQLGLPPEVSVT